MKLTKRITSTILAMLLLLSMSLNAFAAGNPALPEEGKKGSITIHKYKVTEEELKTLTENANGLPITGITYDPLPNVEFTVQKMKLNAGANEESTDISDYTADGAVLEGKTDADGEYTFPNLEQGIYLVQEVATGAIVTAMNPNPFLVSIPMTNPTSRGEWLYDIHVYPKNVVEPEPEIDKYVSEEDNKHDSKDFYDEFNNNLPSTVDWIIHAEIPAGIETAQIYKITDTPDSIHSFLPSTLQISFIEGDGTTLTVPGVSLVEGTHYNVIYTAGIDPDVADPYTIQFTPDGFEELAKVLAAADTENKGLPKLVLKFKTQFKTLTAEQWEDFLGKPLDNDVTLDYKNQVDEEYQTEPDEVPEVHLGGVKLKKIDANDAAKVLAGAKFKIYRSEQDALDGINAVQKPGSDPTEDWIETSGNDGIVFFPGLAYGDQGDEYDDSSSEYWIVEVEAPEGYTMIKAPVKVIVDKNSHLTANAVVIRNSYFTLPITGGMGTTLFTIAGLLLMTAAGALLLRSKKNKAA